MAFGRADQRWVRDQRRARQLVGMTVPPPVAAAYLLLLGWHQLASDERWKVAVLVGIFAGLAAWTGWRGPVALGSFSLAAVMTVLWSADAATTPGDGTGLWLVGSVLVASATGCGAWLVALAGRSIRIGLRRRSVRIAR